MLRLLTLIGAVLAVLGAGAASAMAQPETPTQEQTAPASQAPPVAQLNAPVDSSYVLGDGDIVAIGLVGRHDMDSRVRVAADGTILLPFVGRIKAADRTVLELADDIRAALIKGGFFKDAVVQAEVVGITSRYATILGAVGSPGLLPLDRKYHLSEILAKVGGRGGNGADFVMLTRASGGEPQKFYIDALATATGDKDPVIQPGDKIFIPAAENEVFYIAGEVKTPGAYPVSRGMTFRTAIARGGGVTENGSENKLKVTRGGKPIKVKLEDQVQIGDVIKIGERLF